MSWRKKRKKIRDVKHKVKLIIGLMFTVVIGLIVLLGYRFASNSINYYKIDSRVEKLKKQKPIEDSNYKAIGWLKIQGTGIDLPIVHSEYANEEFPVELESFVWATDEISKESTYYDITGHNIFNLSAHPKIKSSYFNRFEELMAFVYYDFAKKNEYVQLTINDEDYLYKIFAVGFIDKGVGSYLPLDDKPEKKELKETLEIFKEANLYNYDVDVNTNDKIISLSTCTRFYGANSDTEFYVVARLLRDGENINHYKVTKNKKYKKVEKILKGDENNEEDNL